MTEQELKRIANKISKCIALTKSDNPEEVAAAKRQAEAMMKKYSITKGDIDASQVKRKHINAGGKYRPPVYLGVLANLIGKAFGCLCISSSGCGRQASTMIFLGHGIKPELAAYTFEVLARTIKKDRKAYQATLKRFKPKNKKRMADLFCQQWVEHIYNQVHEFAGTDQELKAIEDYQSKQYGSKLRKENRAATQAKKDRDYAAFIAGANAAKNVSIHRPVQTSRNTLLNKPS